MKKIDQLKNFIFSRDTLKAFILSVLVTSVFGIYAYFVGIPLTKSENAYNEGLRHYNNSYFEKAKESFKKANELWPNKDAKEYIEKMEDDNV